MTNINGISEGEQMELKEFTVHDRLPRPITFQGLLLADCRYGSDIKLRWTDMALYRVIGRRSGFRYALQITGRSVVYHRVGGPCSKPKRHRFTTIRSLRDSKMRWDMLFPCDRDGCEPEDLEELADTDRVAEEVEEHHVYLCEYAVQIVDKLYKHNGEISQLAADMLEKAARNDPHIDRARKLPWRI